MVEESVWSAGKTDYVLSFPVISKDGSIYKDEMFGTNLLEKVKLVQQNWVEAGTRVERCADPTVRHNVSNTVTVMPHQWKEVEDYVFENRHAYAGISFLSGSGDKDFNQAPFTSVMTEDEIVAKYGRASLFAAGLIVDTRKGFNDLWEACSIAQLPKEHRGEASDLRADWIRRFNKFAETYFGGDLKETEYCLKDVYLLHRWTKIQQNLKPVDFVSQLETKKFTDVDTIGSAACVGGGCSIEF
jgi:ribonucleoside-diphosphate reductase alpha chain